MPQPGDPATGGVFWMTMFLRYGLAILGWICTLIAMRQCKLNKDEMVRVQKDIAERKAALAK
jgi:Na+/melibiose symporter-like transporter